MSLFSMQQRTITFKLVAVIFCCLLTNLLYYSAGQVVNAKHQLQLANAAASSELSPPIWITQTIDHNIEFLSEAAVDVTYLPTAQHDVLVLIDTRLQLLPLWQHYLLLNGILFMLCLILWRKPNRNVHPTATELIEIERITTRLQDKVDMHITSGISTAERLQLISEHISHLVRREQEVRHLVRIQGLIDHELAIGNRVFFESKFQHYLSDTSESTSGALYIIQIHPPVLEKAAHKQVSRLKACVDIITAIAAGYPDTVLARLSDHDLALLVAGLNGKDIEKLADKIVALLSRASCFADCSDEDQIHVGYARYQRGQTSYQVLSEADMALKTALLHGTNAAYGFDEPQGKPQAKGSVWWRSELNKALQEHRFSLSFQSVYSWQDNDILQHEVLVRLNSSDGDKVPAAIFLPMAHNCGLGSQIDKHVLLKTARLSAVDSRTYSRCSVNISVQSLLDNDWWQWLEHRIISGQIEPQQLALEISEHQLQKHFQQLKKRLQKLHTAGFALIIDQVGLIIDNSVSIEDLPLQSVKLHPSVVREIDQHLEQQLFVRGLVACYASKSILVIATGVEREEEWLILQRLGIAGGQGYYFSQPLAQIITHSQL